MSPGKRGARVAVVVFVLLAASAALAAPVGTGLGSAATAGGDDAVPWTDPDAPHDRPAGLPTGRPSVRVDKNCYFPEEPITITLKNVGGGKLFYDYVPDFAVESGALGAMRMILARWFPMDLILSPGEKIRWTWDQFWQAEDANGTRIHVGERVPEGEYAAAVRVLSGLSVQTLGTAPFVIGACDVQVSAGEDVFVDEGTPFRLAPEIGLTGTANLTSITWDLDPTVDANGDGNARNDADAVGETPELAFGDDGVYPVTLNVRGFLPNTSLGVDQDVVFTIDSSGSMQWNDPQDLRKEAAKAYVDLLVPDDRAAVVDFDTIAVLVNGDPLSADYAQVKENIDRIDSQGGTFLAVGLNLAIDELQLHGDPRHVWIVLFLTDAESITEDDDLLVPTAILRAAGLGIRIYAVGLDVPPELWALMQEIADGTGGKFYSAPTPEILLDIYVDIANEVRKNRGSFFLASDALTVTVRNVAPAAQTVADVTLTGRANLTLRVAGEKWHDVSMTLYRDGIPGGNASVVRMPGSPDEQVASLEGVVLFNGSANVVRVVYTPEDDPVNGQPNGADPVWVIVTLANGTEVRFHHTFNVMHPGTWVWEVDLVGISFGGAAEVALATTVTDPGSDDVTIAIDWGDGTTDSGVYYNDGVGPDPAPSPGGTPVMLTDFASHAYGAAGTYSVTVTISDDDGGSTLLTLTVEVR